MGNEEKQIAEIEVFGTVNVSVKEFMGATDKSLVVLTNYELAKANLVALKDKYAVRVGELVSIEKLSPSELKELNSILSEVRKPRYLIQNLKKDNASVFAAYSKKDKSNWDDLIAINESLENEASDKVKLEDERKKNEKLEDERLEREREANIRKRIDDFESDSYGLIQSTTIGNIEIRKSMLDSLVNSDFDYEEFDILFETARTRVQTSWDLKCSDIQEREEQRKRNEELELEAKENKRISELQSTRLTEIMPYVAFGEAVDLTKLSEICDTKYTQVLESKKALFEADAKQKQDEQDKKDADAKAEKDAIFEIRKNRLAEIGMARGFDKFVNADDVLEISIDSVRDADTLGFECIITNAKQLIQEAKEKHLKYIEDAKKAAEQKALDLKLAEEDAKKLKAENKARIKKFASDKKVLVEFVDSLDFHNPIPELDNEYSTECLDKLISDLAELKKGWINNVNNI